jgi:hypothetical protein
LDSAHCDWFLTSFEVLCVKSSHGGIRIIVAQRILEVIASSDLNKKYIDCVPYFIDFWCSQPESLGLRIEPKVMIVGDKMPPLQEKYLRYCLLVNPGTLPSAFVAQTIRLTEAKNSAANLVMTSDIDMLPLGLALVNEAISRLDANFNAFVITRDVLNTGQYPICYNIAAPGTWAQLITADSGEFWDPEKILASYGGSKSYDGQHGGVGWTIDQEFLYSLVEKASPSIHLIKMDDSENSHKRLDRAIHTFPLNWLALPLVLISFYTDYHVHHPIEKQKNFIMILQRIQKLKIFAFNTILRVSLNKSKK